ncbi:hypothetical protein GPJ56_004952 [Histomonas meleagridis]|uniref:uncharacterized protein n=1 Tax=Histomonas meleagridis TaxID=135588 RepID=UPI00355A2195|nr:hypothetical protein GPJ56_004952 [Histomonas meleagridis]KAH0798522.1 hypothetical protein GO595_008387 [Histomonas meleagridis]
MDKVISIAETGDSYLAVERSSLVVRKLKAQGKNDEAIIFLLKLANIFLAKSQYASSVVCAHRACKLVDVNQVSDELKTKFYEYIQAIQPECSSPELYQFFMATQAFLDNKEEIILKQISISESMNDYNHAQIGYIKLILMHLNSDYDLNPYIESLTSLLWKWVLSNPNEKDQIYNAQFIICRCVLALLAQNGRGPELAEKLYNFAIEQKPEYFPAVTPLFVFTRHFIQSVLQNSPGSATYLKTSYKKILDVDPEINDFVTKIYQSHFQVEKREQSNIEVEGISMVNDLL